jgi:hypothetical protein
MVFPSMDAEFAVAKLHLYGSGSNVPVAFGVAGDNTVPNHGPRNAKDNA